MFLENATESHFLMLFLDLFQVLQTKGGKKKTQKIYDITDLSFHLSSSDNIHFAF